MKKSQQIFERHGGEPIALKAGDMRLAIAGQPPLRACRVVSEEVYQDLVAAADASALKEGQSDQAT